jgi:hypothetical protein
MTPPVRSFATNSECRTVTIQLSEQVVIPTSKNKKKLTVNRGKSCEVQLSFAKQHIGKLSFPLNQLN